VAQESSIKAATSGFTCLGISSLLSIKPTAATTYTNGKQHSDALALSFRLKRWHSHIKLKAT